ncbi:COG2426 family protein [Oligosphaera ethanolica]|uniref:Membrane protein n=1 Tax=Oligosphaera ethanolica TaxID=760260 RepID=A0AAE3VHW4_9BACT|nr:small multi-drug export protein [Oligosphaera ethanolica]MDQ0290701.1 putative membrane protein [Oligosphaera ethanolica]
MFRTIVILFLVTLIPGLELRASIPVGIFGGEWVSAGLPWPLVATICVIANILIGWGVFFLLNPMLNLFRRLPICERLIVRYLERARKKLKPQVEKYGFWGLALFIGIPLPLTGAYTGAAGAFTLGMNSRQFMLANVVGVLIAGIAVTSACLLIQAGIDLPFFHILIKE